MSLRRVGTGGVSSLMLPSVGLVSPVVRARLLLHSALGMPASGRDERLGIGAGPVVIEI